jgi:DNA topoisomerase IB
LSHWRSRAQRQVARDSRTARDPVQSALAARLRYVGQMTAGIRRVGSAGRFRYLRPDGKSVDKATRERILSLAIPPAWTHVWICPDPNGHLQAVGRDAKGRKQYRYHRRWREIRDQAKFGRLIAFAKRAGNSGARGRTSGVLANSVRLLKMVELSRRPDRIGNGALATIGPMG